MSVDESLVVTARSMLTFLGVLLLNVAIAENVALREESIGGCWWNTGMSWYVNCSEWIPLVIPCVGSGPHGNEDAAKLECVEAESQIPSCHCVRSQWPRTLHRVPPMFGRDESAEQRIYKEFSWSSWPFYL